METNLHECTYVCSIYTQVCIHFRVRIILVWMLCVLHVQVVLQGDRPFVENDVMSQKAIGQLSR
jgi:hypothetical protein